VQKLSYMLVLTCVNVRLGSQNVHHVSLKASVQHFVFVWTSDIEETGMLIGCIWLRIVTDGGALEYIVMSFRVP
jgi:hypothetical protein